MIRGAIHLFTVRGIEVRLDYSWFIIFILVTWSLGGHYFPSQHPEWSGLLSWFLGALTSILFFVSVLVHELSHSFVAQAFGTPVPRITLFIFGGAAQLSEEPKSAREEFLMALAGPLASLVIAVLMFILWAWAKEAMPVLASLSAWLGSINLMLAFFNLVPGFPLDGGRVLRSILWGSSGDLAKATRSAVLVGRAVAFGFIFIGIYLVLRGQMFNGIWLAFIGWFLENAATASGRQVQLRDVLARRQAREVMITDCPFIPGNLSVEQLVQDYILRTGRRCYPVLDNGIVTGIVTLHNIKALPREQWPFTPVAEVMTRAGDLKQVSPHQSLDEVMMLMTSEDINQVPVVENGRFLGMISRDTILDLLRTSAELGNNI